MTLRNKKILIMGLGVNDGGVGVTNFLLKQGAHVLVTDLNSPEKLANSIKKLEKSPNLELVLGEHREKDFETADIVLRNPAVPRHVKHLKIAESKGIPIEMESTLFFKLCPTKNIVGVTGTKGKTTTSYLIYNLLKNTQKHAVLAGNMGISMLEQLGSLTAKSWVVLELSSFQIEGMMDQGLSPYIGVYTNILQDHLDRYGNLEAYAQVKKGMVANQGVNDYVVLNADDGLGEFLVKDLPGKVCWYSANGEKVWVNGKEYSVAQNLFKDKKLLGDHNIANLLAAYCVGKLVDIPEGKIINFLVNFAGVPHRLELVRKIEEVLFVNDTTATMPEAALMALRTFEGQNPVIIMGGKDKNLDFTTLVKYINDRRVRVVLIDSKNTATEKYKNGIEAGLVVGIFDDFSEAVRVAHTAVLPKGVVLLSPGCASFGMFVNEFDRGERFRGIVENL